MKRLENEEARDYMQQRITRMALVASTLQDWRSFLVLGSMTCLASAVVLLEEKLMQRLSSKVARDATPDLFLDGAKLLVSQAFSQHGIRRRLWCWLEVCIAVLWLGFVLVLANWAWWLPVAVMSYLIPAIVFHGVGAVLHAPALTILSRGFAERVWALLRTLTFCGLWVAYVWYLLHALVRGDLVAAVKHSGLGLNPLFAEWGENKLGFVWNDFDNRLDTHWMFSWAPPLYALDIFGILCGFYLLLVTLYTGCLLLEVCGTAFCGPPATFVDPEHRTAKTQAVKDLLQMKTPEEFGQVNTKIMPTVAFSWPWKGGGLYFGVALLVLDVVLDANTVFTFLASKHYFFAAVMTFVVARSGLKQLRVLPPWRLRQALKASTERGIIRQDLLDYLEEEKRSEAFFCACITAYAFFFAVQTADQMVVQSGSLLLSTFQFAGYATQAFNLDEFDSLQASADEVVAAPPVHVLGIQVDCDAMMEAETSTGAGLAQTSECVGGLGFTAAAELGRAATPAAGSGEMPDVARAEAAVAVIVRDLPAPAWGFEEMPQTFQNVEANAITPLSIELNMADAPMPALPPMAAWRLEERSSPASNPKNPIRKAKASRASSRRQRSFREPRSSKPQ
ncbi:unnamed protein product, partial [Symbiodinium sp. CCMP2456]